jgi:hypothetical protein
VTERCVVCGAPVTHYICYLTGNYERWVQNGYGGDVPIYAQDAACLRCVRWAKSFGVAA